MRRPVALLMAAASLACRSPDSVVVVSVTADPDVTGVRQLEVLVRNDGSDRVVAFPGAPATKDIDFGTSFSLVVPRTRAGTVELLVAGRNADLQPIASGAGRAALMAGGVTTATVHLRRGREALDNPDAGFDLGRAQDRGGQVDVEVLSLPALDAPTGADAASPADAPPTPDARPVDGPRDGPTADLARDQPPRPLQILYVVSDVSLPGTGDKAVRMRLEGRRFVVTPISDQAVGPSDASGKDLVLISDSARSAEIGVRLRDVTVPVMVTDALLLGDMAMTGVSENVDFGFAPVETELQIVSVGHPLAGGLMGNPPILSMPGRVAWGVPGPGAHRIAVLSANPNRIVIFGYSPGTAMVGRQAVARRLAWPVSLNAALLTPHGWRLFDAAVDWAIGP